MESPRTAPLTAGPDNASVVQASAIRKSFRSGGARIPVLHDIDLSVSRGECLFLAGPSGSGKSTLLSIVGCILSPDEGTLRIFDQDVANLNAVEQARFRRRHIGFVFQRFHLFRGLRAWENVRVVLDLIGYPRHQARAKAIELLEAVGLAEKAENAISQLSVGQCQRVALARALASNPDLILADEPTASLDAQSGLAAMSLLRELAKSQRTTCVVVTHDSRIFSLADRILYLEDGRIASEHRSAGSTTTAPLP